MRRRRGFTTRKRAMTKSELIDAYLRLSDEFQDAVEYVAVLQKNLGLSDDIGSMMPPISEELRSNPEMRKLAEERDASLASKPPELIAAIKRQQELGGILANARGNLVFTLDRAGKSVTEIASALEISDSEVRRWLKI
jgi:hypothetical protein